MGWKPNFFQEEMALYCADCQRSGYNVRFAGSLGAVSENGLKPVGSCSRLYLRERFCQICGIDAKSFGKQTFIRQRFQCIEKGEDVPREVQFLLL